MGGYTGGKVDSRAIQAEVTWVSSVVEQHYQSRMRSLSPKDRVARSLAMFRWTRELLGRHVIAELGEMPDERLKWEVASRLYRADPSLREMIARKLSDVSG